MTREDLEALREGWDFEAKLAGGRDGRGALPGSFWETYGAMANSHGGRIVLGVKERRDHTLVVHGIGNPGKVERELWDLLQNPQKVSANLLGRQDVQREEIGDRTVLVVSVPRASRKDRPVYLNGDLWGGTFIRVHEGDRRCDRERVRRMVAEAEFDSRDDGVLARFGADDLSPDTLGAYRNYFRSTRPDHPWAPLPDEAFLEQVGAIREDRESGQRGLTAAGLLMFGRFQAIQEVYPHYFLDFQERMRETGAIEWTDRLYPDGTWSGNVYDFFRRVVNKLTGDLKVPFQLRDDLYRVDHTHVHEAVREALVNTLIHADYEGSISVLVTKEAGAFTFRNPGGLRLSLEEIRKGGSSDCRNRTLQRMFLMLGIGERAGSGFSRILRAWREQQWQVPVLSEDVGRDVTTLRLSMASLLGDEVLADLDGRFPGQFRQLGEVQRLALATALVEDQVTNRRMQEISDRHPRDLTFMFRDLVSQGFLVPHGERSGTYYTVTGGEAAPADSPQTPAQRAGSSPQTSAQRKESHQQAELLDTPPQQSAVDKVAPTRWSPQELVRAAILELCAERFLTIQEIAAVLGRSPRTIQQHYVRPMIRRGLLEPRFPDQPGHPRQAYRAVPETDGSEG